MSGNGYRLLGFLVWHGGRWYLRRRTPSLRAVAMSGLGAGATVLAGALLAKRLAG